MGPEKVPFPQDSQNWLLVCDLLTELQGQLLNKAISAQDAVVHLQMVYEACQSVQSLDEQWVQHWHNVHSCSLHGSPQKLDRSCLWSGLLKFLQRTDQSESEKFLFTILPHIIQLALTVEEHMSPGCLYFSRRQRGGSTVLSRQFVASILACSFLCLFPERVKDRTSRLNVINFTNFFKQLSLPSQVCKLQCILHYFERTIEAGLKRPGSITFHRQVADRSTLPTLDDLTQSVTALCLLEVHPTGFIEDVGSLAMQVNFANRSIGGSVLGRGKLQEETRFSTCPELIAAMLFMENMDDNEAIIITGFEQFSCCRGYGASEEFSGAFHDNAKRDPSGNLLNTLCAIDATTFRWGGRQRQYMESFLLREINKALIGFSHMEVQHGHEYPVTKRMSSELEEDFITASESMDGDCMGGIEGEIERRAEMMSKSLLSQGVMEAVEKVNLDERNMDKVSSLNRHSHTTARRPSYGTSRAEHIALVQQVPREDASGHGHGGNGERLFLPAVLGRPQNGSYDLLEVDYSEWVANFRRRSSQLSDLTSRRSSSSTKHSSEFSSDLEEIYETLVQAEKAQHGIIEEENYGAALSEYVTHFVASLMEEGTCTAAQMLPGLREFQQVQPPAGTLKPQVVRPEDTQHFSKGNVSSDPVTLTDVTGLGSGHSAVQTEQYSARTVEAATGGFNTWHLQSSVPPKVLMYVDSLVAAELQRGMAEAASAKLQRSGDNIPDDVYVWFADKIVQEVFAHVIDDLYFQRFALESQQRTDTPVNRERGYQSDFASVSFDTDLSHTADFQAGVLKKSYQKEPHMEGSSDVPASRVDKGIGATNYGKAVSPARWHSLDSVYHKTARQKYAAHHSLSESSATESKGQREERKSVTFFMKPERRWSSSGVSGASSTARETARASISPISQDLPAGVRSPKSTVSHLFVIKDVPAAKELTTRLVRSPAVKEIINLRSQKEISLSPKDFSSLNPVNISDVSASCSSKDEKTGSHDVQRSSASLPSPFIATSASSIPEPQSLKSETSSQSYVRVTSPTQTSLKLCDSTEKPDNFLNRPIDSFIKDSNTGASKIDPLLDHEQSSFIEGVCSASSSGRGVGMPAESPSQKIAAEAAVITTETGMTASLSSQDLNLDCYRVAAAIVNQVFQSLPEHISPAELQSLHGNHSSFYYHGRKYESIVPRGSCETAAAVIGASEKGNVVSETFLQNKCMMGSSSGSAANPRCTRSQSPCLSWISQRLSRETLTNAFVKVESRASVKSYERRSSEPCQRSVTLSLQASNARHSGYSGYITDENRRKKTCSDDDLEKVPFNLWRRSSLDSISLSWHRSSCGFKDPVLSRFAQELMRADISVPQLFLVRSTSTTSTTGSRRSSLSGFRDSTLATFESELLNSNITLSQSQTSPRHKYPKRSHSRESHSWKSDSSETVNWFPIPRRVGCEFQERMEHVHRCYSVDEVEDYADFIATTIIQQAVGILYHELRQMTPEEQDINIFSENLSDQIFRDAMISIARLISGTATSASTNHHTRHKDKTTSDSEQDLSLSLNDSPTQSLEDHPADFHDALNLSYSIVESFAEDLAQRILASILQEFKARHQWLVPGGQIIATGSWGCGAFCGDPCLKVAVQWVAASIAQSPRLLYFTHGDPTLRQLPVVVEMLSRQHWTVGQLVMAMRTYCAAVLDELDSWEDVEGAATAEGWGDVDGFVPSHTLFDFLLMQQ